MAAQRSPVRWQSLLSPRWQQATTGRMPPALVSCSALQCWTWPLSASNPAQMSRDVAKKALGWARHAQLRATAGYMRDKAEGRLSKEQATDLRERINARQTAQSR